MTNEPLGMGTIPCGMVSGYVFLSSTPTSSPVLYELLQLQATYDEAIATYIMNFISILSGYLLANHFLGSRINTAQFVIMTVTYTFIMCLTAVATYHAIELYHLAEVALEELDRSWVSTINRDTTMGLQLVMALAVTYLGSLYFSLTSRRQYAERT